MATLKYQVLVIEKGNHILASVPDLRCEAVGASPTDAIATVHRMAVRTLQGYEGRTVVPPEPARLTLDRIELPAPSRRSPRRGA
jgi:hypothetical protein